MKDIILISCINGSTEEFVLFEGVGEEEGMNILNDIQVSIDDSVEEDFVRFEDMLLRKNSVICIYMRDCVEVTI